MENYIHIIAALIIAAVLFIALRLAGANSKLPEPQNGQPVLDNQRREWVFLRTLKDGTFLFRTPQGKINSITLDRCIQYGFTNQFDFETIQK